MTDDVTVDKDKFDAVLQRLITAKPQTEAETREKAAAIRTAKAAKAKRKDSE